MSLTRSDEGKWIAGVASGLSKTLGVDVTIIRLVFVLVALFLGGGVLLYVALWLILPRETGGTLAEDGLHRAQSWYAERKQRRDGGDYTV